MRKFVVLSLTGAACVFAVTCFYGSVDARAGECGMACRREQRACITSVRKDYRVALHACDVAAVPSPMCVRDALEARTNAGHDCRDRRPHRLPAVLRRRRHRRHQHVLDGAGRDAAGRAAGERDAVAGRDTLLMGNVMTCGVPYKLWQYPSSSR
jgi:hypothetical protein